MSKCMKYHNFGPKINKHFIFPPLSLLTTIRLEDKRVGGTKYNW